MRCKKVNHAAEREPSEFLHRLALVGPSGRGGDDGGDRALAVHDAQPREVGARAQARQQAAQRLAPPGYLRDVRVIFSNHTGPPHLPVTTTSTSPSLSRSTAHRFTPEPMP